MRFKLVSLFNTFISFFIIDGTEVHLPVPYQDSIPGDCGIACVAMVLQWKHIDFGFPTLVKRFKVKTNYSEAQGWKHRSLAKILKIYGIGAKYYRYRSLLFLVGELKRHHCIIASVKVPPVENISQTYFYQPLLSSSKPIGHLVVITGKLKGAFIINDPRNEGMYTEGIKVPFSLFAKLFTGNCIVAE